MIGKKKAKILVFDSGFGGLSVLLALFRTIPAADYIYLADDARFPYGELDEQELTQGLERLLKEACRTHQPDLIVIACNSASTIALPTLRSALDLPVVGIVPGIKPAALASQSGHISVLATPGTMKRSLTHELVREFAGDCQVNLVACPRLAEMAERFVLEGAWDSTELGREVGAAFVEDGGIKTDVVVLGCTHYPLIQSALDRVTPWPVLWIDPAPAVARRVMLLLGQEWQDCVANRQAAHGDLSASFGGSIRFLSTGEGASRLTTAWARLRPDFVNH
ncbi:MAG: glutamate racemase [Cohaesibacter sp.]|jgi:glutamate racemase|nr:glutamate racemase [Cohaesibacter sp.]